MSRLLLLEDDLSLINGLSFALGKQGFELEIARTLREAQELWTEGRYDLLIFAGWQMPLIRQTRNCNSTASGYF